MDNDLDLQHLFSLHDENAWSDLLATFIESDPQTWSSLVGVDQTHGTVVRREVRLDGDAGRIDLVVHGGGVEVVVEVKLLSGLGREQLRRYRDALPSAACYLIIHPATLAVDGASNDWIGLTWELILNGFSASSHNWVATTSRATLRHLRESLPELNGQVQWGALSTDEDINVGLKARASWVYRHLSPPAGVATDLKMSSAGASWVPRMWTQATGPGYWIMVNGEESRSVRNWPPGARPLGMSIRVSLLQQGVATSAGFDWDYLLALWPLMNAHRSDWIQRPARPKSPHDREGVARMRAAGAPPGLGIGFGEAQCRLSHQCLFGARFQLPPTATLAEIVQTLDSLGPLVMALADLQPSHF